MTVKQLLIARNSELQCAYLFKTYSLNHRMFARDRAHIERIFYAFCDIVYCKRGRQRPVCIVFIFRSHLKIILAMTALV